MAKILFSTAMDAAAQDMRDVAAWDIQWEESDHPRAENGQFGSGGSGSSNFNEEPTSASTRSRTPSDEKALEEYTGVNFRYANAVARGERNQLGDRQKSIGDKLMHDLDKAWETIPPSKEARTTYRGVHTVSQMDIDVNHPEKLVGKSFKEGGWVSTTDDLNVAKTFASGSLDPKKPDYKNSAVFQIESPAGTRRFDVKKTLGVGRYGNEKEVVLPRNGRITITGFERSGGMLILKAKYT